MVYKYSAGFDTEHEARAVGIALPISFKKTIEICNMIRKKEPEKAKAILKRAIEEKEPIPFKRFNKDTGHKRGMAAGRYPKKTCLFLLKLIEDVEANAQSKGLDSSSLVIEHIAAKKAPKAWHFGRKRRRQMKRTHVEIVVKEQKAKKSKTPTKRAGKKTEKPTEKTEQTAKTQNKPEQKKEYESHQNKPQQPKQKKASEQMQKHLQIPAKQEEKTEDKK